MSKGSNGLSEFDSHHYHLKFNNMIDNCMRNTFGVLTNRCSIEDVLSQYEGKDAMFYGNPYQMTLEDVEEVINYFENTEEFEKCSELVKYKNMLDLDLFLEKLRIKNGQTEYGG